MKRLAIPAAVFILFIAGYVTLWFMAGKISVPVVQTINWIILASAVILTGWQGHQEKGLFLAGDDGLDSSLYSHIPYWFRPLLSTKRKSTNET